MKKIVLALLILAVVVGCARTWQFQAIDSFRPADGVPAAAVCQICHAGQYESWKKNRHSNEERMAVIPVAELHECGACHSGLSAHVANPATVPSRIAQLTKTEQNTVCGKCHYNQTLFGSKAINPHDKHALYASVGFEGQTQQLSCLDCHSGHQGKSEMLVKIKAHICYTCHTGAIAGMAIFQPFGYLTFGKACQACHAVHGGSKSAQWGRMGAGVCVICHFVGVALVD